MTIAKRGLKSVANPNSDIKLINNHNKEFDVGTISNINFE
jgi:hypothetical protein